MCLQTRIWKNLMEASTIRSSFVFSWPDMDQTDSFILSPWYPQVAMANRLFSEDGPSSELPCMDCLRVEWGEKGCYNGEWQQRRNNQLNCDFCDKEYVTRVVRPRHHFAGNIPSSRRRKRRRSRRMVTRTAEMRVWGRRLTKSSRFRGGAVSLTWSRGGSMQEPGKKRGKDWRRDTRRCHLIIRWPADNLFVECLNTGLW